MTAYRSPGDLQVDPPALSDASPASGLRALRAFLLPLTSTGRAWLLSRAVWTPSFHSGGWSARELRRLQHRRYRSGRRRWVLLGRDPANYVPEPHLVVG